MSEKGRMANLELLRCVAMMMVVVLHYLGKGGLLGDLTDGSLGNVNVAAWLLEAFCIVAVNVYMLISGYFLSVAPFKLSRLLCLLIQVWLYSVAFGVLGAATGIMEETVVDTHYFLALLFPISMGHYWFLTAYVFLYLFLPFVGIAVKRMTKRQMQLGIGLLLFSACVLKSILPFRLDMVGTGYDWRWYLCVFLAAAYIRKFGVPFLEKKGRALCLYVSGCLLIFTATMALRFIFLRTGRLGLMTGMCMEYNHILPFLAAVGLFGFFTGIEIKGKIACVINRIAPYTLGVYLLHENLGLRFTWQKWFGADRVSNVGELLLFTLLAAAGVFCCGILVDALRAWLTRGIHRLLCGLEGYRKLMRKVESVDDLFKET